MGATTMIALAAPATMTTPGFVQYVDEETFGPAAGKFSGAILADSDWEVPLIRRVLALERRHPETVTTATADRAVGIIRHIAGLDLDLVGAVPFISPVADGGLIFEWKTRGGQQLNIAVLPEGTTEYLKWETDERFDEDALPASPRAKLGELLSWLMSAGT
jgi:hypothetical protein